MKRTSAFAGRKILVFSYAFPPLAVAVSPCVVKNMAALARLGYTIDVICAEHVMPSIGKDDSLTTYTEKSFSKVIRIGNGFHDKNVLYPRLANRLYGLMDPDIRSSFNRAAFEALVRMGIENYTVITFSPFHSVNPVMVNIKHKFPRVRWIAQFSDPWADNPLERRTPAKLWAKWNEPRTVRAANFLVHNSTYSMALMLKKYGDCLANRISVIPHPFERKLYPQRPKKQNSRIVLRHVGVLFEHRSPEPLFSALALLFNRRKELRHEVSIELVGKVEARMLESDAAKALPDGTIKFIPSVSYVESLEIMYDADVLVLIEANAQNNLFMPSKLSDYIGANVPIVGIVPPGAAQNLLHRLGAWQAHPGNLNEVSVAIEKAIDFVRGGAKYSWCNEDFKEEFSSDCIALRYRDVIENLS